MCPGLVLLWAAVWQAQQWQPDEMQGAQRHLQLRGARGHVSVQYVPCSIWTYSCHSVTSGFSESQM